MVGWQASAGVALALACCCGCRRDVRTLLLQPSWSPPADCQPHPHTHTKTHTPCLLPALLPARPQIKDLGCKAGVVLNPGTPLTAIEYVLPIVDLVLIMSVNPGFGGQKFIQSQVDKIRALKKMCNEMGVDPWIEVDGGVTPENAWRVIEVGANAIVSGSGVYGAKDYATAIQGIKNSKRPAGVAA